jgi:5-methylcytosine-specific restriction endonuclease McrA
MTVRPCIERDCPRLVKDATRCPECAAAHERKRKARGLTGKRGSTHRWRKARRRALIRDGYRCVRCDCPYPLEVDHINGDPEDHRLENLQTLCVKCHHDKHGPG